MELQGLQEALKVEIQCHQLAVRNAKPLSLIKSSQAIATTPAKAPVSMVTTHANGQKALGPEPPQKPAAGLLTASAAPGSGPPASRRAGEPPHSQMLGHPTAGPIKVPQVHSLTRLPVQKPTVLPQVRPKTLIPDGLPHSPAPAQLANGLAHPQTPPPSGADPAQLANGLAHPQTPPPTAAAPTPAQISGAGVAYAIISTSPAGPASIAKETMEVHPLLLSSDSKVIIIQPQGPSASHISPEPEAGSPDQETTPTLSPPANEKSEEDQEKITFMVALGLVTTEHLEEIQSKRQERKRRTTANPAYSGLFEPERKRLMAHYLNSQLFPPARDTEDLYWKEDLAADEHCAVCKEDGELQPCHGCARAYHPACLHPPLRTPPTGAWHCPSCQRKVLNKDDTPWTQNFIQSYLTHKTVRQEERRRLRKRNSELKKEYALVEEQDQQLTQALAKCVDLKHSLLGRQKDTRASLERLKALIRLIQRDQVIQVTMMATTTSTGTSLLSLPWIKPTSTAHPAGGTMLLQKSLPQKQSNN
ncbi:PHD finger protein 21B-like isoform X1 [Anguilla anguilla]|uniref:PHD finger protein 21B-like isoform X1 n=1 Tax=Anguilla anguilla TaxID=7936 RepID=UPI0015B2BDD3|nr:PHD finger protein 21B-like isoform X1 [Anguilla anguilla]